MVKPTCILSPSKLVIVGDRRCEQFSLWLLDLYINNEVVHFVSSDINGMTTTLIKTIKNIIRPTLTKLINQYIIDGVFPKVLKKAIVLPVYKKGNNTNATNYRPIPLLPIIAKFFEKCSTNRMTIFSNINLFISVPLIHPGDFINVRVALALLNILMKFFENMRKDMLFPNIPPPRPHRTHHFMLFLCRRGKKRISPSSRIFQRYSIHTCKDDPFRIDKWPGKSNSYSFIMILAWVFCLNWTKWATKVRVKLTNCSSVEKENVVEVL